MAAIRRRPLLPWRPQAISREKGVRFKLELDHKVEGESGDAWVGARAKPRQRALAEESRRREARKRARGACRLDRGCRVRLPDSPLLAIRGARSFSVDASATPFAAHDTILCPSVRSLWRVGRPPHGRPWQEHPLVELLGRVAQQAQSCSQSTDEGALN